MKSDDLCSRVILLFRQAILHGENILCDAAQFSRGHVKEALLKSKPADTSRMTVSAIPAVSIVFA